MELKNYEIGELRGATYNPKSRTDKKAIRGLRLSIERIGLQKPLLITKDRRVVDGHKRLAVYKALRIGTIPCVITANENAEEVYAEVNAHQTRLTGTEALEVWLKKPDAVTRKSRADFERAETKLGRKLMERIAQTGNSLRVYKTACKIAKHVDKVEDDAFLTRCVAWLIKYHCSRLIESYAAMKQSPRALVRAIEERRELKPVYV